MALSFDVLRCNLLEVVSTGINEACASEKGPQLFSTDLSEQYLYQRSKLLGASFIAIHWLKDSLIMEEDNHDKAVLQVIKKTEEAFDFYLKKAFFDQKAYANHLKSARISDSKKSFDRSFLIKFSTTFKSFLKVFKGPSSVKVQAIFNRLFSDVRMYPPNLQTTLDCFFTEDRLIKFEILTGATIPLQLLLKLDKLNVDQKKELKVWFDKTLLSPYKDWNPVGNKAWARKIIQELPKIFYFVWRKTGTDASRPAFYSWIYYLREIIDDYKYDSSNLKLPAGPLLDNQELVKALSIFSVHNEIIEREGHFQIIPLAEILWLDPYRRAFIREKLDHSQAEHWAPALLKKIFDNGAMPISSGKIDITNLGIDSKGMLKTKTKQDRVEIDFKVIDDFVWEVAGGDFEKYRIIYKLSGIQETSYGKVLKAISYNSIFLSLLKQEDSLIVLFDSKKKLKIYDSQLPFKVATELKLNSSFIDRQVSIFIYSSSCSERPIYHDKHFESDDFFEFWQTLHWESFPGLWFRHKGVPFVKLAHCNANLLRGRHITVVTKSDK